MDNYLTERNTFYKSLPSFWDRLYGLEYAVYDCYLLEDDQVRRIQQATNEVYNIFAKVNQLLRNSPAETFQDLGFPEKLKPFLRMTSIPLETVIGRFDFIMTEHGPKLIEFNADTPTFIRELFDINGEVCQNFGHVNPNDGEEQRLGIAIREAIKQCAASLKLSQHPYVVFTAHEEDIEDRETLKYLMKVSQIKGATFCPLDELQIVSNGNQRGVYDQNGKRIDIVYRHTYPLETLIEDKSEDGYPIGLEFLTLVKEKKVAMLNPISAFLMQNKAVLALIWGLHELDHPLFTKEEHTVIARYFLPTYLDEEPFLQNGKTYVEKPVFGREGDTVEIKQHGKPIVPKEKRTYDNYEKIYQQYVPLPTATIVTETGKKEVSLLIGSFVINGQASAFGIRAGAKITDNLSYFLPCGVKGVTNER